MFCSSSRHAAGFCADSSAHSAGPRLQFCASEANARHAPLSVWQASQSVDVPLQASQSVEVPLQEKRDLDLGVFFAVSAAEPRGSGGAEPRGSGGAEPSASGTGARWHAGRAARRACYYRKP